MNIAGKTLIRLINDSDLVKSYCEIPKDWKNIVNISPNSVHREIGEKEYEAVFYGSRKFKHQITTNMLMKFSCEGVLKYLENKLGKEAVWREFYGNGFWKPALLNYVNLTVDPDANPESTSVDGRVIHQNDNQAFATIRDGVGTAALDTGTTESACRLVNGTDPNTFKAIYKGIWVFDINALPASPVIKHAKFILIGSGSADTIGLSDETINVYSAAPASNTALAAGDFDSLGTTAYSTSKTRAQWANTVEDGYNDFVMNSTGLAAIVTADAGDGIVKLGTREATYDVANVAWDASGGAGLVCYFAVYTADFGSNEPKLQILYNSLTPSSMMGVG